MIALLVLAVALVLSWVVNDKILPVGKIEAEVVKILLAVGAALAVKDSFVIYFIGIYSGIRVLYLIYQNSKNDVSVAQDGESLLGKYLVQKYGLPAATFLFLAQVAFYIAFVIIL